jgi:uncharacterized membrane protein YhhN
MARRATAVYAALAAAGTLLAATGRGRGRWLTKPLLMPVLMAGHLAWIAALRQRPGGGYLRARAVPHVAAFGAMNAYLWKRTGPNRIPVLVYSTALKLPVQEGLVMATYTTAQALLAG